MKPFLILLVMSFSMTTFAQTEDYSTVLSNSPKEINALIEKLETDYNFKEPQLIRLRQFIEERFAVFNINPSIDFPDVDHWIRSGGIIEFEFGSNYYSWIDLLNMSTLLESQRSFVDSSYDFSDTKLVRETWNVVIYSMWDPFTFTAPDKVYFIITDMDRL